MTFNSYFNFQIKRMYWCLWLIYTRRDWLQWMEEREMPWIHKYGETKNDSNYDGNCTSRDFQFGTWKISGHLIFVEQRVPSATHVSCVHQSQNKVLSIRVFYWHTATSEVTRSHIYVQFIGNCSFLLVIHYTREFVIDIILPAALWPWGWLSL